MASKSRSGRKTPGFAPETGATMLVGRWLEASGTPKEVLAFIDAVTKLAPDSDFRVLPAADFSSWDASAKKVNVTWAMGVKIEATLADWGAIGCSIEKVREKEQLAAKVLKPAFWKKVDKLAGAARPPLLEQKDRVLVVPWGPLASAYLMYGTAAEDDDADVVGTDMSQEAHGTGVSGEKVVSAEDWQIGEPDLSPAAHKARARNTAKGEYFLVPRYD